MATWLGDLENQALINEMTIAPQTISSTLNGASVDMQLAEGPVSAILGIGTVTGTTGTLNVKLQEATDGSTWTDITNATFTQVTTTPATTTAQSIITLGKGNAVTGISRNPRQARWMRAVATTAGTSPSFPTFVQIIAQKKILGNVNGAQTT